MESWRASTEIIDMKLDVRLTNRFLDQLWCHAVVVFLFEDDALKNGRLSRINEILVGTLTPLLETRFITGARGEIILIAPQQRIKAEKLLFMGLGPVSGYSARIMPAVIRKLSSCLDRLHVNEFCFMVPRLEGDKKQYEKFVKSAIGGMLSYFEKSKKDVMDFILKVLVSVEKDVCSNMQSLQQSLKNYLDLPMDYTIVIDESRGL
jgi:hypothetical protein